MKRLILLTLLATIALLAVLVPSASAYCWEQWVSGHWVYYASHWVYIHGSWHTYCST